MKVKNAPLSIRIFYWLTNIVFGLLSLVFLGVLVFNILLYTDFFGDDIQLHTNLPVKVDFAETGNLYLAHQNINVELVEATGRIHFFNTPYFITRKIGIVILLVVLFAGYLTWTFRRFITNVKNGEIFNIHNIVLLKRISYIMVAFWMLMVIYTQLVYHYIAKRLVFENVIITDDVPNYAGILFIALFIWVLAHIFITGLKLQQEKDLTI